MAFAAEPNVVLPLDLGQLMRWDHRFAALVVHVGDKPGSGVATIGDDLLEREPVE